jgi:hypothetical protein
MSTVLKSHTKNVLLTRFYGGHAAGTCIEVNTNFKCIGLTREQAGSLAEDLLAFANKHEQEGDTEWDKIPTLLAEQAI